MEHKYSHNMNSTEEQAPLNTSVEATHSQAEPGNQKTPHKGRRGRRRHRHRHKHKHRNPHTTDTHSRPQETEGTQQHEARQNHSTYDRDLHHRSQGGTGYGYRRDVTQPESELRGDQLPPAILPSYERNLLKIAQQKTPQDTPSESETE